MKKLKSKKLDVCICAKNRGAFIRTIVENVKKQSFQDFNIILSDGRSLDSTVSTMIELQSVDPGIKLVQTDENGRYIDAHNLALNKTVSEYVCWIDSDDVMTVDKLEKQVKFLDEHPDVDIVTTGVVFNYNGLKMALPNTLVDLTHEEIEKALEDGSSLSDICHFQTAMFRRSCLKDFSKSKFFFDEYEDGRCGEGFLLTLYYLGHKFANIGEVMYAHNLLPNGMTAKAAGNRTYADKINEMTPGRRKQSVMRLLEKHNK